MNVDLQQFEKSTDEVNIELLEKIDYHDMLFCIAKSIMDYREYFKYSQQDIAKKLDVSQVMISKIESGKNNLSVKLLVNLWNKLSTEEYNFSKNLLNRMLQKASENYNLKYNLGVFSVTIKEETDNIIKLSNIDMDHKKFVSYHKTIKSTNDDYSNVI